MPDSGAPKNPHPDGWGWKKKEEAGLKAGCRQDCLPHESRNELRAVAFLGRSFQSGLGNGRGLATSAPFCRASSGRAWPCPTRAGLEDQEALRRTTVMLSGPPWARASSINRLHLDSSGSEVPRASSMSCSRATPCNPSLHNMTSVPGAGFTK